MLAKAKNNVPGREIILGMILCVISIQEMTKSVQKKEKYTKVQRLKPKWIVK